MPEIETRTEQPYAAVRAHVTMSTIGELGARFGEVFAWLGARGVTPSGAPFFRYLVVDMARELVVEAGVPVASPVTGDVLPAGRYASLTQVGPPDELIGANKELQDWVAGQGLAFDVSPGEDGDHWGCRLEFYLTDPSQEPDPSKWVTQLAFRLA
jgi:hypothetical protein